MNKNVGNVDRIIRVALAVVIGIVYFTQDLSGGIAILLGIVAVILLATSLMGTCPIYLVTKLSTKKD